MANQTEKPHRPPCPVPCAACPFRRASLPGWLGADTPEGFVRNIMAEVPLPCHKSLDYERADWQEAWEAGRRGKMCRGALIFAANVGKSARPGRGIPSVDADEGAVFATVAEFIAHHRKLGRTSGDSG